MKSQLLEVFSNHWQSFVGFLGTIAGYFIGAKGRKIENEKGAISNLEEIITIQQKTIEKQGELLEVANKKITELKEQVLSLQNEVINLKSKL